MNIFFVSLKNLKRKPARARLLFGLVVVVSCTLFTAALFVKSMENALRIVASRFGADIIVVPKEAREKAQAILLRGEPAHFLMERSVLDRVRSMKGVKAATPQIFFKPEATHCCSSADVIIIAFDPDSDFTVTPWLERNLKRKLGSREVVVGKKAPARAGDSITFFGTGFVAAGSMESAGMDFLDKAVFMSFDAAYFMAEQSKMKALKPLNVGGDQISAVLVQMQTDDDIDRSNVVVQIEHRISGVSALVTDSVLRPLKKRFNGLVRAVLFVGAVLWLIVLLILGFAFSLTVRERQRETGLLRAMGANRGHIAALFLSEAALLTVGGGAAGIILGYGTLLTLKNLLFHYLKLPYLSLSPGALAGFTAEALVLSVLSGMIAALLPSFVVIRMSPYEAIVTGD